MSIVSIELLLLLSDMNHHFTFVLISCPPRNQWQSLWVFFNCFIYEKNFIDDRNLGIQMTINFNTENTLWSYRCTLLICPVPINAKLISFTIKLNFSGTKHKSLFNNYLTTLQNYFTFFLQYWLTYFF